ncbi:MAG: J domain-containing protein [Synergistaceae bacterium]|nr:J domain-containing protein [Synergistaceae bacterium]
MKENLTYKINSSFNLLGLKPGADARQIRSAFRRLARTHHPDIAGSFSTKKYEQISNAYILLKNLSPEELSCCDASLDCPPDKRVSFFIWWKRKYSEKEQSREAKIRAEHEEEVAKEARERAIYEHVDSVLEKLAREINTIRKRKQNEVQNKEISDIIIRLEASREEVRIMTVQNLSKFVNVPLIMDTLLKILKQYPITGKMLDSINKFQLPSEYVQKIIRIVSDKIEDLNEQEALAFIKRTIYLAADNNYVISKFMEHPSLKITEFLITRWTFPALPSEVVLKNIFSDLKNEKLIISALNMLKRYDKRVYPRWLTQKINELLTHENTSVRLWARAISSNENMVK